jgi:hypothetical protein
MVLWLRELASTMYLPAPELVPTAASSAVSAAMGL